MKLFASIMVGELIFGDATQDSVLEHHNYITSIVWNLFLKM